MHSTDTANGFQAALRGHGRRKASRGKGVHRVDDYSVTVMAMVMGKIRCVSTVSRSCEQEG